MDRGFYTSVSGMMCGSKKLGDIANNIANINTIGYKKDLSMITEFSDLLINKMDENVNVGDLTNQVNLAETYTLYGQGSIVQTTLPNDYAITGDGFFKIDKEGEYVYARDGSFKVDADGYLVTSKGYYVMDRNNNRILVEEGKDYSDELMVVNFENLQTLQRIDDNNFINKFNLSNEVPIDNSDSIVRNGYLEMSNVDAATELTDMITTQRYYQFNQRALSVRDSLLEEIAKF